MPASYENVKLKRKRFIKTFKNIGYKYYMKVFSIKGKNCLAEDTRQEMINYYNIGKSSMETGYIISDIIRKERMIVLRKI